LSHPSVRNSQTETRTLWRPENTSSLKFIAGAGRGFCSRVRRPMAILSQPVARRSSRRYNRQSTARYGGRERRAADRSRQLRSP
jgi:hypothetical protein